VIKVTFETMGADLETVAILLECAVALNQVWIRANPYTPNVYDMPIRYAPEDGSERWLTIPLLMLERPDAAGYWRTDCNNLAAYRAAWLRENGYPDATAFPIHGANPNEIHCLVSHDGTMRVVEDPSAVLGARSIPTRVLREALATGLPYVRRMCAAWRAPENV
jgi:hypothetical protein